MRDAGIDCVKCFAILCIAWVHAGSGIYASFEVSASWLCRHIPGVISRAGVPLFLMCSGALFLDDKKQITLKGLWQKYILRIFCAMFFWAFVYKIYHLKELAWETILSAMKEILLFNQEFHLYYLHIILLIYALTPIVKIFTAKATRRELIYALAVWFAVGVLYPTFSPFTPLKDLFGIPQQWKLNMTYSSIGYFMLGYCIKKYPMRKFVSVSFVLLGFLFTYFGTVSVSLARGEMYMGFLEGMTLGTSLLAIGIYGILMRRNQAKTVVERVSRASFCIYLLHMLVLYVLRDISGFSDIVLYIPVIAISFISYCFLSKIPVLNKWII